MIVSGFHRSGHIFYLQAGKLYYTEALHTLLGICVYHGIESFK